MRGNEAPRALADLPRILILNGPNLNLLGEREPEIYGSQTLAGLQEVCEQTAQGLGLAVDFRQSNHEGELIAWIHEARDGVAGVIINAAGLTHTSVAIRDALSMLDGRPVLEVHLSNIYRRERFRHRSMISGVADGVICGLGGHGYTLALAAMARLI